MYSLASVEGQRRYNYMKSGYLKMYFHTIWDNIGLE